MYAVALALVFAAAPASDFGGPARAVLVAHADLARIAAADEKALATKVPKYRPQAPRMRYLWVSSTGKKRDDFLVALSFHLNLLSTAGSLKHPTLIAPDVVRLDVADYGWDEGNRLAVYEKLGAADVFFHGKATLLADQQIKEAWPGGRSFEGGDDHEPGVYTLDRNKGDVIVAAAFWLPQKEIDALRFLALSESPVLHAEWFLAQTCRQLSLNDAEEGFGYYDWLGLKNSKDFYKLTGVVEKDAVKRFAEWRAVVEKRRGGVSNQNRIVSHLDRKVWVTLDVFTQKGRTLAKRNLRRGEFLPDAFEFFGSLANGLPVTFLANKDGEAQATAPDKIGGDTSSLNISRDNRIHANLSCIRCHGLNKDFLEPVDDWARPTFRAGGPQALADPDKKVLRELESLYLRGFDELLDDGRRLYSRAVRQATVSKANPLGLTSAQVARLYAGAFNDYVETPVTLESAARQFGVGKEKFLARLKAWSKDRGIGDLVFAAYLDEPPEPIDRADFDDSYALGISIAWGIRPPETVELRKVKE